MAAADLSPRDAPSVLQLCHRPTVSQSTAHRTARPIPRMPPLRFPCPDCTAPTPFPRAADRSARCCGVAGARARLSRRMTPLASTYLLWLLATWRDKRRLEAWGPQFLRRAVQRLWFDQLMRIAGVTGHLRIGLTPAQLRALTPCVVTCSPHGAFAVGLLCFHANTLREDPLLRLIRAVPVGASVLFKIPLLRDLLLLLGVREATPATCDAILQSGRSVALNPGGIWEQVHTSHRREVLHLQPGLGFIRLAMRHGVPLVPTYGFGENQLYESYGEWTLPLRQWIADRFRVGIPLVRGRYCSPLPLPTKHTLVVGRPVPTGPPNLNPTKLEVEEVLGRWEEALRELFNENKDLLPAEVAREGLTIAIRPGLHGREARRDAIKARENSQPRSKL
ncbi:hypothetical protein AB1Y20_021643 [Prymnesium parvum]|uniref:Acyltransferase n=1 Tax=Prymnesium parvum TaxID=97485 RepID=A0AB34JLT5_PRYPA